MARARTSFRADFVLAMTTADGWPTEKSIRAWRHDTLNRSFMRAGMYSRLIAGEPGTVKQLSVIVEFLCYNHRLAPLGRKVLNEYLAKQGIADIARLSGSQVLPYVMQESVHDDGFGEGYRVLAHVFESIANPAQYVRVLTPSEEESVLEAVRWMYIISGRTLTTERASSAMAIQAAERRAALPLEEYQARAVSWWRKEPWTVVQAWRSGKPSGMSLALPVSAEAYAQVRAGRRRAYDCTDSDIVSPSAHILVEGFVRNPGVGRPQRGGPGWSIFMAVACQHAFLSRLTGCGFLFPLRFLAHGGTSKGKSRAERFGFKPIGQSAPTTGVELLERVFFAGHAAGRVDSPLIGAWEGLRLELAEYYRTRHGPGDGAHTAR